MSRFPQTDWSMIHDVALAGSERAAALDGLVRRYWHAVYAFIRRTGCDVREASDLTQGFMTTVILERRLAERADPSRGRFRTYLVTCLRNFLRERQRSDARRRRRVMIESESGADMSVQLGAFGTPEEAFDYHWAVAVGRRVLERVASDCHADGLDVHWAVFESRVGRPLLTGEPPASMGDLVARHDLTDADQVSNLLVTVKRRFARALREEVAGTLTDPDMVNEELSDLQRSLERHR